MTPEQARETADVLRLVLETRQNDTVLCAIGRDSERSIRALADENEQLREALRYYADRANYTKDDWGIAAVIGEYDSAGRKARAALGEEP